MAVRKIVRIDEEKCNGCGQCILDCPEGALRIIDGKARVVRESYCDGLGACLGVCPVDAITVEEREAEPFDEEAVKAQMAEAGKQQPGIPLLQSGCPGAAARPLQHAAEEDGAAPAGSHSQLSHWPVQLSLVSPAAPFLHEADLLLVADCVPFAMADFHARLLRGRPIVVGCPKLDDAARYVEKLTDIIRQSSIRSLSIIHMEVPCCGGLCHIAKAALEACGQTVPVREVTVSVDGRLITQRDWQD